MGIPVPTIYISPTSKQVTQLSLLTTPTAKKPTKTKATPTPVLAKTFSLSAATGGLFFFIFLIILGIVGFILFKTNSKFGGFVRKTLLAKISDTTSQSSIKPATVPGQEKTTEGEVNKEYFVKKQGPDEANTGFWVDLTGDSGHELGHYKAADVIDGFAQVKGIVKTEKGKTFLEISEIKAE